MLEEIRRQILSCKRCPLAESRTHAVPGEGPPDAEIMLVGEGPGHQEDVQGRPFVGPAGQLLGELLEHIGVGRDEVFISNIVKCRPPGNRTPSPDEVAACNDYLIGQIASINPKIICPLGGPALAVLLDATLKISRVHGTPYRRSGITYFPMYHPAAALHKQDLRGILFADMEKLRRLLDSMA